MAWCAQRIESRTFALNFRSFTFWLEWMGRHRWRPCKKPTALKRACVRMCVLECKIIHCFSCCLWNFETCGSETPNGCEGTFVIPTLIPKQTIHFHACPSVLCLFALVCFLNGMHGSASNASFRLFMLACFRTGDHHLLLVIPKLISFSSVSSIPFHSSLSLSLVFSTACTNYLSFCRIRATGPMRWHEMYFPARNNAEWATLNIWTLWFARQLLHTY